MTNLTLGQFQEIFAIQKSEMNEEDKMTEMVAAVTGKSVHDVEEMPIMEFNKLSKQVVKHLSEPLPEGKPKRILAGVGITYEPTKLNRGQYITVNHFMGKNIIENAHNILAALSYNPKSGKHEPDKFKEIAESFQDVAIADVLPSCLFFCNLYGTFMKTLESYLAAQMMMKGVPMKEAKEAMKILTTVSDGFIMQSRSQTLKT